MPPENLNADARLPPLNALRAFESVARHLSIKAAADELCVTPGAVSQHVKTLEHHFGLQLLSRHAKGVTLSSAAQVYATALRNAFDEITVATRTVRDRNDNRLRVSTTSFFAAEWLVPRLGSFQSGYPDIDVDVLTTSSTVDVSGGDIDVAIRHGMGRYAGLVSEKILEAEVAPVGSKSLVERLGKPRNAADLLAWPLIHDTGRDAWTAWFKAQGVRTAARRSGPAYGDGQLLVLAALHSQGAALLPTRIIDAHDRRSELVRLAGSATVTGLAYYLVYSPARAQLRKVAAFREWLLGLPRLPDEAPQGRGAPRALRGRKP